MARLTAEIVRIDAEYLAEAISSGQTLAPFPQELTPRTAADARRIATRLARALGVPVVGVRLVPPPAGIDGPLVAGPVLGPRLLHAPAATPPLHRPSPTAALVAQLGTRLPARAKAWSLRELVARIASLHAAIDIGASRFTAGAPDLPCFMADLAGLGAIVLGRQARAGWQERVATPCAARATAEDGRIAWRGTIDAGAALRDAAEAARSIGDLPAGAVLVAAGLSPPLPPGAVALAVSGLGRAELTA